MGMPWFGQGGRLRAGAKALLRSTMMRGQVVGSDRADRPLLVRIDLTDLCNQLCIRCYYPDYLAKGFLRHTMPLADFEKLAEEMFHLAYYVQLPFGFEPLMHPQFDRVVQIVARHRVPNASIVTNGSLLLGKRADAILETQAITGLAVSIDSTDPERFRQLRGRDHCRLVVSNIERFMQARRDARLRFPCTIANTVIMRSNVHELHRTLEDLVSLGVDEVQMFHVDPMDLSNPESALHCPEAWNEAHERLGEVIRRHPGTRVYIPPPYEERDISPEGRMMRRHTQFERLSPHETYGTGAIPDDEPDSYPSNVFCVCPWMVAIVDSRGNVYTCAHRNEPVGNVLRDGYQRAYNSWKQMVLRRDMQRGVLNGACAVCTSKAPSSDPLKRRVVRAIDWQPSHAHEENVVP